jgi:hypothetical protein
MIEAKNIPLNCGTISNYQFAKYFFKKPAIGGDRVKIVAQPQNRIILSTGSGYTTNYDATVFRSTNSSTITDFNITLYRSDNIPVTVYSTDNTILLNLDSNNSICSGVPTVSTSTRNVKIIASGTNTSTDFNIAEVTVQCNVGGQVDAFCEFTSGSLAKNCSDNIDNRLLNKNPNIAKNVYSTQNHSTSTYVRNIECWAYGLDLTCMSPWNTNGANTRAGTLISPSHLVFASHYEIDIGSKIRFVSLNNEVIERTLVDKIACGNDASLGLLDSDVPNSISFAKMLPSNWSSYLPTIYRNSAYINNYTIYKIPILSLDQEEKALVKEFFAVDRTVVTVTKPPTQNYLDPNNNYNNTYPNRLTFYEEIIGGDSGNPSFLIINNQLVLITTWLSNDSGPFYTGLINVLNTNMNLLWTRNNRSGSSYTTTVIDLSSFTLY